MPDTLNLNATPLINPLNQDDYELLHKILEDNRIHQDLIRRCQACGLDMSERANRAQMHHDVATKLLEQFFPTMLTPPVMVNDAS